MASDHPFQMLFETLGRIPTSHAESVNRHAYEILSDILTVPVEKPGRCILLRAPRAGHGKTHLLSRIQHYLGSTHEFIPLHPAFGCRIDAVSVTDDALRRLVRPLPASGGLCVLDLITRRLFAVALQPLVGSGEVPCQDREGALSALRTRPIETFDFHHPNAVTAHWARENFEVLGQRLSMELAQRCNLPVREIAFWVEALFRFAATPVENAGRVRALSELVHSGNAANGESMERLEALLGLISLLMRVVLVADDLEGFSADETAALRLAAFLGSLRQSVERLDVILSLNQDIWQSAFVPRLSGGLTDRLSEVVIELNPLTENEMVALLDSRVPGLGSRVLERIDLRETGTHARGLIRAAGMAWLKATAMDSAPPAPAMVDTSSAPPLPEALPVAEVIPPVSEPVEDAGAPVFQGPPPVAAEVEASLIDERPAVESSPFTFSTEAAPALEVPISWPAPEFSPAPRVEEVATPVFSPPVSEDSPFQFSAPEPASASFTPPGWQETPHTPGHYVDEPAPAGQYRSESIPSYQPQIESPFQAVNPIFTPEPAPTEFNPPPVESSFQAAPQFFDPAPPASFSPPDWQEIPQPVASEPPGNYQPQVDSPFQIEQPAFTPEPLAAAFPAAQSQNFIPAFAPQGSEPAPALQPSPQPVASSQPDAAPPAATPDTDRVDDLLRQFRERYGRGSL